MSKEDLGDRAPWVCDPEKNTFMGEELPGSARLLPRFERMTREELEAEMEEARASGQMFISLGVDLASTPQQNNGVVLWDGTGVVIRNKK